MRPTDVRGQLRFPRPAIEPGRSRPGRLNRFRAAGSAKLFPPDHPACVPSKQFAPPSSWQPEIETGSAHAVMPVQDCLESQPLFARLSLTEQSPNTRAASPAPLPSEHPRRNLSEADDQDARPANRI